MNSKFKTVKGANMKMLLILTTILMSSSLSFASKSKCKILAEKAAKALFSLESSASEIKRASKSVKLLNTSSNPNSTVWQVTFSGSIKEAGSSQSDLVKKSKLSDSEWSKIYEVKVTTYNDGDSKACFVENVTVTLAG